MTALLALGGSQAAHGKAVKPTTATPRRAMPKIEQEMKQEFFVAPSASAMAWTLLKVLTPLRARRRHDYEHFAGAHGLDAEAWTRLVVWPQLDIARHSLPLASERSISSSASGGNCTQYGGGVSVKISMACSPSVVKPAKFAVRCRESGRAPCMVSPFVVCVDLDE